VLLGQGVKGGSGQRLIPRRQIEAGTLRHLPVRPGIVNRKVVLVAGSLQSLAKAVVGVVALGACGRGGQEGG